MPEDDPELPEAPVEDEPPLVLEPPEISDVLPDPPRLSKGLKLYPVKPELAETLKHRADQFSSMFGIR